MKSLPMMPGFKQFCICIFLVLMLFDAKTQTIDSLSHSKPRPANVIKLNLSALIVYDKAFLFSYERVLSSKRSISVFGGYQEFPFNHMLINNDDIELNQNKKKSGFSIGADYRFYLAKENKHAAPRGVYLAPFISYYSFSNEKQVTYYGSGTPEELLCRTSIGLFNIGGELGYQFVIKKRFVIDAVMFGPSLTAYRFKIALDGNISPGDRDPAIQDILDALKEKFPLLNELSKDQEVSSSGISNFMSVGFRYSISIGYRF